MSMWPASPPTIGTHPTIHPSLIARTFLHPFWNFRPYFWNFRHYPFGTFDPTPLEPSTLPLWNLRLNPLSELRTHPFGLSTHPFRNSTPNPLETLRLHYTTRLPYWNLPSTIRRHPQQRRINYFRTPLQTLENSKLYLQGTLNEVKEPYSLYLDHY